MSLKLCETLAANVNVPELFLWVNRHRRAVLLFRVTADVGLTELTRMKFDSFLP